MMPIKLCSQSRAKRCAVIVKKDSEQLVQDIIISASVKMKIDGVSLVLEEDGVEIDEDLLVQAWGDKLFMLLGLNETWSPAQQPTKENQPPNGELDTPEANLSNAGKT